MMAETIETVERWAVRGAHGPAGHVSTPERVATGVLGAGLLMLSRRSPVWRVAAGVAAGAAFTRAATGVCPIYAARGARSTSTAERLSGGRGVHIREAITIARPLADVFTFWRALSPLAAATGQRISVDPLDAQRSQWTLRTRPDSAPLAVWTAELINEVPNQVLGWRTVGAADVVSAGSVNFAAGADGRETDVRIHLQYDPPLGRLGAAAAAAAGHDPATLVRDALHDVKRHLEVAGRTGPVR